MWDPIYHTHSHITHTQPLTLITHAVCLWCARARGVLSMRFISAAVPISRDVSYLLSCDIAIPWLCERLHVHVLTNAHHSIHHPQPNSVFDVSRSTGLPAVNLEALLECHKVKAAPTVDAATKTVHKSWGRVHARVRSCGYFLLVIAVCKAQQCVCVMVSFRSFYFVCLYVLCVDADAQASGGEASERARDEEAD